ncbi:putative uncharacterized protein C6orf52 homolog isoform X1 [Fukomys damarensis]|uniref:tRNA selenocysteine 1-associated protein 1 C-terminal domain-containing protein n=1 Tax=Fukomys damarensis TaxID=885580 RepID=A0A091DNT3_FUKDA|nr:putative uncharacterized protein C6orf52 homolog isoform X1 [Fukomys damarensis]XP_033617814.1 putative uncharacterized protein C6orf52 homolog isoform X1 [Fukomys damarensis]KFO33784.1 hypothetical protein H920_04778 [Fukomys damarensis]
MARWQNFAEFGTAQENNYYYYWQREKLELQPGQDHSYDVWYEQPPGFYTQSRYSYSYAVAGSGPEPFMYEVAMHPAGTSVTPQETKLTTKFSAEGQDEDSLEDPNLPLNVEELNKECMARSEELYDSLMDCHWQPLDTVHSSIPEQTRK